MPAVVIASALYADGRFYDLLYGNPEDGQDIAFILDLAGAKASTVLELACGTGRLLAPLAERGHDVIGIDSAPAMLAEAQKKIPAARLVQGDMRDFSIAARPSLVILAGNSICHLVTNEDVARCFESVRRHLDPGSRFVIDVFVPSVTLLARSPTERNEYGIAEGVAVTYTAKYDPIAQVNHITLYREDEPLGELAMRMFFPQELVSLVERHGLRVVERYGDFAKGPLTASSAKQLLVCTTATVRR